MKPKPTRRVYGYGIVDRHDGPWGADNYVCSERGPMHTIVDDLNENDDDPERPYRVVRLFYMGRKNK